jgi:hypothetical protein
MDRYLQSATCLASAAGVLTGGSPCAMLELMLNQSRLLPSVRFALKRTATKFGQSLKNSAGEDTGGT